tara:strand:+ start:505 stop:750 length:246 start_codon:yes stop_codon:yes gene_type:complete
MTLESVRARARRGGVCRQSASNRIESNRIESNRIAFVHGDDDDARDERGANSRASASVPAFLGVVTREDATNARGIEPRSR